MLEAKIKYIDGKKWVCCPYCEKRAFPIEEQTQIKDFIYQCKISFCKKQYKVNVEP